MREIAIDLLDIVAEYDYDFAGEFVGTTRLEAPHAPRHPVVALPGRG